MSFLVGFEAISLPGGSIPIEEVTIVKQNATAWTLTDKLLLHRIVCSLPCLQKIEQLRIDKESMV